MDEMSRDNAKEVEFSHKYGESLDAAVKQLEEYRANGESVFINFNGHNLYSCDVTIDSAYIELTGQTKAENDKAEEERRKEDEQKRAEIKAEVEAKIPDWIEKGKAFIYPERWEKWAEFVKNNAEEYDGRTIVSALELMEELENGKSMEEVIKTFNSQGHSSMSALVVQGIMCRYSKKGPEFVESSTEDIDDEGRRKLEDIKSENAQLAELHKGDSLERKAEEKEIVDLSKEKQQLISGIGKIKELLARLKAKITELIESRGDK